MKKCITSLLILLLLFLSAAPIYAAENEGKSQRQSTDKGSIYYILIDRFVNGTSENDYDINIDDPKAYYGGDLQGIVDNLDYIKQLGFTTINLSPVMSNSEDGYHGFLIDDFRSIEENFGSLEDLKTLVQKAHEVDIKVMLDFVVTHTSSKHPWTNLNSDWLDGETDKIWGSGLPKPDLDNPQVEQYFLDTAAYWMEETGIDGYRLYIDENTPATFIQRFNELVHSINPDFFVLVDSASEMDVDKSQLDGDAFLDNELYRLVSSTFRSAGNPLEPLFDEIDRNQAAYIDKVDTIRFTREAIKQGQNPTTRWKLALTYLYTTPGNPVIYQGSEVPMDNGVDAPDHQMAQLNGGNDELRQYIEKLAAIRKQFPAITKGSIDLIESNGAMSLYKREYQDETIYIAINNDTETKTIAFTDVPDGKQLTGLIQGNIVRELKNGEYRVVLNRETADVFMVEEDTGINWLYTSFLLLVIGSFVFAVVYLSIKGKRRS